MAKGYSLVQGDKTSCGGEIPEVDPTNTLMGLPLLVKAMRLPGESSAVLVGDISLNSVSVRQYAGTLNCTSRCPCQSRFIPLCQKRSYEA